MKNGASKLCILDAVRTPLGKAQGALASLEAADLGRLVARELLDRNGLDPKRVDEVIFGCVGQNARAANIARVISLRAGIPESVPAMTVHRNCASGIFPYTVRRQRSFHDLGGALSGGIRRRDVKLTRPREHSHGSYWRSSLWNSLPLPTVTSSAETFRVGRRLFSWRRPVRRSVGRRTDDGRPAHAKSA